MMKASVVEVSRTKSQVKENAKNQTTELKLVEIINEDFPRDLMDLLYCIAKLLHKLAGMHKSQQRVFPLTIVGLSIQLKKCFPSHLSVPLFTMARTATIEKILIHLSASKSDYKKTREFDAFRITEPCLELSDIKGILFITNVWQQSILKCLSENPKPAKMPLVNPITVKEDTMDIQNIPLMVYKPTAIQCALSSEFKDSSTVREICEYGSRQECANKTFTFCPKIHYKKIILSHTNTILGDCSYLDTCRHIETCRFVHYELEHNPMELESLLNTTIPQDAQWISCDVRKLNFGIFNPFVTVVMADPPWDIHMDLPYGTMKDGEMKSLKIQDIQQNGLLFLWVTGRTIEVGKECMEIWGYRQIDEIIWVKINQLQRVVRTGRTGHWLNHSKEHCIVGMKGNPLINKWLDVDVIVSEVRETSRKPDEIYNIIERMAPGALKLELFGRAHNLRSNWITLGNQLDGYKLTHSDIKRKYEEFLASNPAQNK